MNTPSPHILLACCLLLLGWNGTATSAERAQHPNIVFILVDDLGYGDLGCYGQQLIQTPRLDQMAAEGMRFTDFYAGNTVCAPSRSVLMTGQHMGHTHVRGNASGPDMSKQSLRDQDVTVAEVLQDAGYETGLCGKWGLGDEAPGGREGLPRRQGFDFSYGYLNQVHAHNYYPEFLWRNETKSPLRNVVQRADKSYGGFTGGWATKKVDYSHDLIAEEALGFIDQAAAESNKPFFLYLSLTIPHANNEASGGTGNGQEIPDFAPYADKDWSDQDKGQAAMITRMDGDVGRLLDRLDELGIANDTVVMFSSDNGPHDEGGHDTERFDPAGPLQGMKRDLYEGGIRVPLIVRWPGTTPAGTTSDHISYFGDLMASAAELAGVKCPDHTDSISFVPTITGHPDQQVDHEYLYWEFYEQGGKQAVRAGKWKAIRMPWQTGATELFDLSQDIGEATDLASENPGTVKRLEAMMDQAHTEHPNWQARGSVPKRD
ncbi:arylsulfatase [Stieleria sp. TO1_6]|uniref:arylsulfatase n=1 Tax=Stieleria tagensis TaxID=2956795 RepID=UPI00209B054A|nr:arylsulfatase [Stieleria tagensis]MCO8121984.1 arylsulfatase [Stieleria tagensis]